MTRGANVMFRKKRFGWNLTVGVQRKIEKYDRTERERSQAVDFFFQKRYQFFKRKKKFLKILMPHQYHTIAKECCLFF